MTTDDMARAQSVLDELLEELSGNIWRVRIHERITAARYEERQACAAIARDYYDRDISRTDGAGREYLSELAEGQGAAAEIIEQRIRARGDAK